MDVWFIILISLSLCFCIKFLLHLPSNSTKTNQSKTGKLPPGPSPLPFIGNLHLLPKTTVDLRSFLRSLSLKYGPVTTLHIGSEPVVFITSYSAAHEALVRNSAAFASRPSIVPLSSVLSNKRKDIGGSPYGQTWRVLRRNLNSEVLHPARVKSYSLERKRILGTLVNSFNQCFLHGDQPVRVLTHIHHAVFSLFILMAFGHVNDSTIREVERIQAELIFNYEQFTVFCSWPRLGKLLFRDRWKRYLNILKSQAEIILPLIRARKKLKQEESKQSELVSYTDTLLDMQMNNNHHQEFGKLEEADILSLCSEFMNAGADTSLTTLQWIMANIVKHPHIQAKLFAEIKAVVGEGAEEIKEEDVQKMTYLKAVVLETLRIHPPSTFLVPHAVLEDAEVLGYRIPKDTTVNFAISLMGRDPKEWDNPMEFRPERLLNRGENGELDKVSDVTAYKMMPFGSGRRICPGMRLAMLNLEYFVSNLVWNFEWKAVDGEGVDLSDKEEFLMVMKNPLRAHVSPRIK
ncbi:hypothetical protein I3843_05G189500 [Carya illinoinensis]|nr:hypothetical protein I3843_05G189500 [Carya illinoinensis]